MLYTFFVLVSGIFLQQEYPNAFPSIKVIIIKSLQYLHDTFPKNEKINWKEYLFKSFSKSS
jgi:cytochrome b subunit of formate dehydrogenase